MEQLKSFAALAAAAGVIPAKNTKKVIVILRNEYDCEMWSDGGITLERYLKKDFQIEFHDMDKEYICNYDLKVDDLTENEYDIISDRLDMVNLFLFENESTIFIVDSLSPEEMIKQGITTENIQKFLK